MQFAKATKKQAKLRFFLAGPSGSGKTWTSLAMATALGKRVAVIDTEHHSAEKYADQFEFDTLNLDVPSIEAYTQALRAADAAKYDVVIIDSLSHAWYAAQEMVDAAAARMKSQNTYMAWGSVTPVWNGFLRNIITSGLHVIGTSRSKCDYVLELDQRGKSVPKKVGLAPIMREGAEYEFDVAAEMDLEHRMLIGKTRCNALDGKVFTKPGADVAQILLAWLGDGAAVAETKPTLTTEQTEFNAWVKPLIDSEKITREFVKQTLGIHNGDYSLARKAIEGILGGKTQGA